MLTFLFFLSVFSSLIWLIYSGMYVHERIATVDLSSQDPYMLALYAGLIVLPVWIIWQVLGFINQYFRSKSTEQRLLDLCKQMKKNQDYTDLVVRVMLDAEHEIKDGFVVNKFDIFVADMNEILADIVQRCNVASSMQIEQLWLKVKNGERWSIAKTFIENLKRQEDFTSYLAEKARKDSVFKGTMLEFCARYQNLSALLEKHDRDRVFITILQTGVMGKVYSILAPIAGAVSEPQEEKPSEPEEIHTVDVSPEIIKMEAPLSEEKPESVISKINPFKKRNKKAKNEFIPEESEEQTDDVFFSTLKKNMSEPERSEPVFETGAEKIEPLFSTLTAFDEPDTSFEIDLPHGSEVQEPEEIIKKEEPQEEDFAYPFGGWTDEASSDK